MNAGIAAALLDAGRPIPITAMAWNGSDPTRRFAVHRNNSVVSLVDALAVTFPVTMALLGDQCFKAVAQEFVRTSPPTSPVLFEYGDAFPDFLARHPATTELQYLADVARLERLRVQAYHAADALPLPAHAFQAQLETPEAIAELRIELHPACRWLRSTHALVSIWAMHLDAAPDLAKIDPSLGEDALIVRPEFDVLVLSLPAGGSEWLDALAMGASLGDATAKAIACSNNFDLTALLALVIRHGMAVRFTHLDGE
jgi:hypothetical protein